MSLARDKPYTFVDGKKEDLSGASIFTPEWNQEELAKGEQQGISSMPHRRQCCCCCCCHAAIAASVSVSPSLCWCVVCSLQRAANTSSRLTQQPAICHTPSFTWHDVLLAHCIDCRDCPHRADQGYSRDPRHRRARSS